MHIDPWILAFSLVMVVLTIGLGLWSAKKAKTASDFFVAGRSVSVGWNASAISGEYLSAASFMGIAGMVMKVGYDALWYPVCYACGYLFLLLFIAGPLRRFGAYTIPDFAEGRYDSPLFRKIAVVFVLFIGFFYTMPQMKGAGTTLAYIFPGLDYRWGVILVGAVITFNVALGGMKGITLVQAFQYWAKMFAISVPVFVLMAVCGHYGKQIEANTPAFHRPRSDFGEFNWSVNTGENNASNGLPLLKAKAQNEVEKLVGPLEESIGDLNLCEMLIEIAKTERKPVLMERSCIERFFAGGDMNHNSNITNGFGPDRQLEFSNAFAGLNYSVIPLPKAVVVVPSTNRSEYLKDYAQFGMAAFQPVAPRTPLPDKAPTDPAWLAPFGPLTTKAAKAANASPRWNTSAELRATLTDFVGRPAPHGWGAIADDIDSFIKKLQKPKREAESMFATWTNIPPNVSNGTKISMLSALGEFGLLSRLPVLIATNVPRPYLDIHGTFQTQDEIRKFVEAVILTNGVRLERGKSAIKALPAADWDAYKKNPSKFEFIPLRVYTISAPGIQPRVMAWNYGQVLDKAVYMSPNLPTNALSFNAQPNFQFMLAQEAATGMKKILNDAGISLLDVSPKEIWAVPTADLARYQLPPINVRALSLLYTYSLIIALVCGTAGLPHILVRFYTNPDGVAAKRTTMWVMILIGVFYLFPPIVGVLGRNLLPELYSAVGAKGTDKIVLELPSLLNKRIPGLGSVLSGITCAGAFAAFMSTFSGLLVSMTGALAHDVYGRILRPASTAEQRMRAFKICAVLVGAVAIVAGMQVEKLDINFMVGQAFAIAAASYFPLLFLSTWWRGMTMKGAAWGMLGGGLLALAGISLTSFSDLKWLQLDAFWTAHPLLRILCEQPAIWAVPLAITLMLVISKLTRREIPSDIRMKMLVLHAPEKLGLKQEYVSEMPKAQAPIPKEIPIPNAQ